jgi:hypothetical protein
MAKQQKPETEGTTEMETPKKKRDRTVTVAKTIKAVEKQIASVKSGIDFLLAAENKTNREKMEIMILIVDLKDIIDSIGSTSPSMESVFS